MNIEEKTERLLNEMSLEEKIGQLNQVNCNFDDYEKIKEDVRQGKIGAFVLAFSEFAGEEDNNSEMLQKLDELQRIAIEESPHKIPLLFGRDVIHGFDIVLPIPLASAASFNPELVKASYRYVAQAAAANGIKWSFAPMLDCSRDPRWGRIIESPGEDPYLGSKMAEAMIKGFQGDMPDKSSVAACAKHYIGYGASEGGRDYYNTDITEYTLRNYYLPAFKSAVDAGAATVMSAFNEIGGEPVTSNKYLITDVLKKELSFKGFVVSDWGAIPQLKTQGVAENDERCCELSLNAGIDMDMATGVYSENIHKCIQNKKIKEADIDEAVRRVLKVKFKLGLFDNAFDRPDMPDTEKFAEVSRRLAEESMVLLKNKNNTLPINRNVKIGLMGLYINDKRTFLGSWCLDFDISKVHSYRESFEKYFGKERIITSVSSIPSEQLSYMMYADVIVAVIGESHLVTGEAHSMANIEPADGQIEILKQARNLGKPVIALITCGRACGLQNIEQYADAILYTWHCGSYTADAACGILRGDISPSGHLPVTFPGVTGQIPIYYNAPSPAREYVSGYYRNCTQYNYRDMNKPYMYPFGFGLSYTEFVYGPVETDKTEITLNELRQGSVIKLNVDVKNDGHYNGQAVVQVYIHDKCASMTRPLRELKQFKKVFIGIGNAVRLEFELGFNEFAFYNKIGEFCVEPGEFEIFVGNDCLTENKIAVTVLG